MENSYMQIVEQSFEIIEDIKKGKYLDLLEYAGRTCYNSRAKISDGSAERLLKGLIANGHESVLEHEKISINIITSRSILAELTRHRLCSFSVASQRYIKYDNGITVIKPLFEEGTTKWTLWYESCLSAENTYLNLLQLGAKAQEAREVLPNSTATELVMTANLREWRTIFRLRTDPAAHPQMRQLMTPILKEFNKQLPVIFEDLVTNLKGVTE